MSGAVTATVASLLATVSVAHADDFGELRTIVPSTKSTPTMSAVAVSASGRAAVAWVQTGRRRGLLRVRLGRVTGQLGRAQTLSRGRPVYDPAVAVGADGTAAVIWVADGRRGTRFVRVAQARPGRAFGRAQTLLGVRANVTDGHVAVGPDGHVVAVWWQGVPRTGGHEIRYALRMRGRAFSRPHDLAPTSLGSGASVAVGPDDTVYVTWATPVGQRNQQAAVAALPVGANRFGPPQIVSGQVGAEVALNAEAEAPRLFAGAGGVALSYGVGGVLPNLLQVAFRASDGRFGPPRTADSVDVSPGTGYKGPVIGLPAAAPAVAVWSVTRVDNPESANPVSGDIEAAAQRADGSFEAPTRLSTPGAVAQFPLAVTAGENVIAVWGEGLHDRLRLRYSIRPPAGPFTPARRLAAGRADQPSLASAGRYAVAAWVARVGRGGRAVRMAVATAGEGK